MNGLKPLKRGEVIQSRRLEIEYFRKMEVYSKVPRKHAKGVNTKVITTKWFDTNKGNNDKPNYRSRLVGCEIKMDKKA